MSIVEKWKQIPGPVKIFSLKAVILFITWKALYLLVLLPGRVLDQPLTYMIGVGTTRTLNAVSHSGGYWTVAGVNPKKEGDTWVEEPVMHINLDRQQVLSIADVCNGLEVMVLYAGLILCLPASIKRKISFILSGIVLIEVLNVIRCAGLAEIYLTHPEYLDFSHHYLFTFLVYAFIFWLWFLFSRHLDLTKKQRVHVSTA
jgi:exosortase/archaeosortase family protein